MTLILNGTTGASAVQPGSIQTDDIAPLAVTAPKMAGNQSGTAPIFGARAWVNFDATRNAAGGTDSANTARYIRAGGNVSSVVKNGTGDYRVNFTTAMDDANYAVVSAGSGTADSPAVNPHQGPAVLNLTTTYFDVSCGSDTNAKLDWVRVCLAVFR